MRTHNLAGRTLAIGLVALVASCWVGCATAVGAAGTAEDLPSIGSQWEVLGIQTNRLQTWRLTSVRTEKEIDTLMRQHAFEMAVRNPPSEADLDRVRRKLAGWEQATNQFFDKILQQVGLNDPIFFYRHLHGDGVTVESGYMAITKAGKAVRWSRERERTLPVKQ